MAFLNSIPPESTTLRINSTGAAKETLAAMYSMYSDEAISDCVVRFGDTEKKTNSHVLCLLSPFFHARIARWSSDTTRPIDLGDVLSSEFEILIKLKCGSNVEVKKEDIPRLVEIIDKYNLGGEALKVCLLGAHVDDVEQQTIYLDREIRREIDEIERQHLRSLRNHTFGSRPPRLSGCVRGTRDMRLGWWYVFAAYPDTREMYRYIGAAHDNPRMAYIEDIYSTHRIRADTLWEVLSFDGIDLTISAPRLGTYTTTPFHAETDEQSRNACIGRYVICQENRLSWQLDDARHLTQGVSSDGLLLSEHILLGYHDTELAYVCDHHARNVLVALLSDIRIIVPITITQTDTDAIAQRDQALEEYQQNPPEVCRRIEVRPGDTLMPGRSYTYHTREIRASVTYLGPYIHAVSGEPDCIVYYEGEEKLVSRASLTHVWTD